MLRAISQSVRVGLSVGLALLMLATMLALAFTACRDPGVIPKQLPEQLEVTHPCHKGQHNTTPHNVCPKRTATT